MYIFCILLLFNNGPLPEGLYNRRKGEKEQNRQSAGQKGVQR